MTADPQDAISEITEKPRNKDLQPGIRFARATGWGTLAGTLTLAVGLSANEGFSWETLIFAPLFAGFFVCLFTFVGMVVICLPLTALLKFFKQESLPAYALLGGLSGFLVMGWDVSDNIGWVFALGGGASGLASGVSWGRWREQCAQRARADGETESKTAAHAAEPPPNPFHEMIH